MTATSADRVAWRVLGALLLILSVVVGWQALVHVDWGTWLFALGFAGAGLGCLAAGER